jgi:hypothetical protein
VFETGDHHVQVHWTPPKLKLFYPRGRNDHPVIICTRLAIRVVCSIRFRNAHSPTTKQNGSNSRTVASYRSPPSKATAVTYVIYTLAFYLNEESTIHLLGYDDEDGWIATMYRGERKYIIEPC